MLEDKQQVAQLLIQFVLLVMVISGFITWWRMTPEQRRRAKRNTPIDGGAPVSSDGSLPNDCRTDAAHGHYGDSGYGGDSGGDGGGGHH